MTSKETFEFNHVSQDDIELAMQRAHELRSEFAFDAVKSVVKFIKSALSSKTHVQGGSNLAHSA